MRIAAWFAGIALSFALASSASAQWVDNFDTYLPGGLASQSLWDEWTGKTGVDAFVVSSKSFTPSKSVLIVAANDVVWDFRNSPGGRPTSGLWSVSVKIYVPSGATGSAWYILLNEYPMPLKYSVQTQIGASAGMVFDGSSNCPLRYDEWVSLVIAADLDNNVYSSWYGDQPLAVNQTWSSPSGATTIAVNDLYGDSTGCSSVYFDSDRLDKSAGGPLVVTTSPNPVAASQTLTFYSQSPSLGLGDIGALFLWSVNGAFTPLLLSTASFDATGTWTLGAPVPTGLSGYDLGFRMFAAPAGGKIMLSNEDIVVMK